MRLSTLLVAVSSAALLLLAPAISRADYGPQTYPLAYVDRPLTLAQTTLGLDATFDATRIVEDPSAAEKSLTTEIAFATGASFGITEDLEVRASLGTIRILPEFAWLEPRVGATFRFVGADIINIGVHAEAAILTLPGQSGIRFEAGVPFLLRLGSAARLDFAPGAQITLQEEKSVFVDLAQFSATAPPIQQQKAVIGGITLPVQFAFQIVEILHVGARTSVTVTDLSDPGRNLVIPLGFVAGVSIGDERPIVELDPFFTWDEFARPGAELDNEKVSIDKFSAGLTARLYLFL